MISKCGWTGRIGLFKFIVHVQACLPKFEVNEGRFACQICWIEVRFSVFFVR